MFKPVSIDVLKSKIFEFKAQQNTAGIVTNFFNISLENKDWFLDAQVNGLFFWGSDDLTGLGHYYFLANISDLSNVELSLLDKKKIVSEFVFDKSIDDSVKQHYADLGFKPYAHLVKMSLLKKNIQLGSHLDLIELCTISDLAYLRSVFDDHFDPISERHPSDEAIFDAIKSDFVHKYIDDGNILGFYWVDTKKYLTEMRYFFVDECARGLGIGKALLEHHLVLTRGIRKNQLWVLMNNKAAIFLYQKYGYHFESLQDFVFLKV